MSFRSLATELLDLWAPPRCLACDVPYPALRPSAPLLCALCVQGLEPAAGPPPGILVPFAYGGPLARAIHRAKAAQTPAPARTLGKLLVHALAGAIPRADVVVPVPLHPRRLAARGFNQAVEMGRALGLSLVLSAVLRHRHTPPQRGLGRSERIANVQNAFAPVRPDALAGLRVLVIDDVVTTGATLSSVVLAVRAAGATEVTCLALARAAMERTGEQC